MSGVVRTGKGGRQGGRRERVRERERKGNGKE